MIDAIRLYRRYAAVSMRGQMQYRASFVMETIGQFSIIGVEFVGILVLFSRFDTLEGWSLPQVAFLYSLVHLGFAFANTFSRGFDSFGSRSDWATSTGCCSGRARPPCSSWARSLCCGAWAGSCWRSE